MSQENVEAVRGLPAQRATRLALLLSLLAFGALGMVACDDDDETATAEAEVITSEFGRDPPGRGPVVAAGDLDACGDFRTGPGRVTIEVFNGAVRCREARRVLKHYYPHERSTPPWSCVGYANEVVCTQPGGIGFQGTVDCRVAIVKSIAQAHDGTFTVAPRTTGGLCATVQLPAAPPHRRL